MKGYLVKNRIELRLPSISIQIEQLGIIFSKFQNFDIFIALKSILVYHLWLEEIKQLLTKTLQIEFGGGSIDENLNLCLKLGKKFFSKLSSKSFQHIVWVYFD